MQGVIDVMKLLRGLVLRRLRTKSVFRGIIVGDGGGQRTEARKEAPRGPARCVVQS